MEDLHNDAIIIVVHHDNIHAYDAIVKAITDAACKQAENYHVKIEVITKVEYLPCEDSKSSLPELFRILEIG